MLNWGLMPKAPDEIKDLQRALRHLGELDGRPLWTVDGLYLLWPVKLTDPEPLLASCRDHRRATLPALRASLQLAQPPVAVKAEWLAKLRRDLRRLEHCGSWREQAWETHKALAKFPRPDRAWLEDRAARLQAFQQLHPPPLPSDWFEAALDLVGWLRGPQARETAVALAVPADPRPGWRQLRERVEKLAACLRDDRRPLDDPPLEAAWQRLRRLRRQPAPRRILLVLARLLGLSPYYALARPANSRWDLPDYVRRQGLALLERLRRTHPSQPDGRHQVAGWSLLFAPEPGTELGRVPLSAARPLAGRNLTTSQVVTLVGLEVESALLEKLADHAESGLPTHWLEALKPLRLAGRPALHRLAEMPVEPVRTEVWCAWVAHLAPHFETLGVHVDIPGHLFGRWASSHASELLVMAQCLYSLPISALDSTLAIFNLAPEYVPELLEGFGTAPGLGASLYPDFAAWLGDADVLDRHLYLQRCAGHEPALSQSLLRDFSEPQRLQSEREWLASLTEPSPLQLVRLKKLSEVRSAVDPQVTRGRLRRLNLRLLELAVKARIDDVGKTVVQRLTGVRPTPFTPALRDALRLFLGTDENEALSRTLLNFAVRNPGRPIERTLPLNQTWLEEAASRFPVQLWLSERPETFEVDGQTWRLRLEEDPLEVLRMGTAFGTCLSLPAGSNAASTLVNALDANKRVLYVRDERGEIRARKLLAISRDWSLLGYHLYQVDPDPVVEEAVARYCSSLAQALGTKLGNSGQPVQLHPGEWYDDGPEDFVSGEPVAEAYCEWLGRPAPRRPIRELSREARAWAAWRDNRAVDVVAECAHMWGALPFRCELARRFSEAWRCAPELLSVAEAQRRMGTEAVMTLVGGDWHTLWPSVELGELMARALHQGEPEDDEMAWTLPADLRLTPLARALILVDLAAPRVKEEMESLYFQALLESYARMPDSRAVLRCLTGSRRSLLARRCALEILAAFPFPSEPGAEQPPWSPLDSRRPVGCRPALAAVRQLARRFPQWAAAPALQAALLRQAEPGLDAGRVLAGQPRPARPPFGSLADLQLHPRPGLSAWLAEWSTPAGPPESWRPGEWELEYHRRHPDLPWRQHLRRAAQQGNQQAMNWLRELREPGLGAVYAALEAGDLEVLLAAELPTGWPAALVRRFVRDPSVNRERLLTNLLHHQRHGGGDVWRSELITELWQDSDLRPALRPQLTTAWHEHYDCWPVYRSLRAAAERLKLTPIPLEEVLLARDGTVLSHQQGFDVFDETLERVFCLTPPARWVEEYLDLNDAWSVSRFLQRVPAPEDFYRLLRENRRFEADSLHGCWVAQDCHQSAGTGS